MREFIHGIAGGYMLRAWLIRIFACILIAAIAPSTAQAQGADELAALNEQIVQLHGQGKYAEAGALAEQVLAASERGLGPEHPGTLTSLSYLALLYHAQGRYEEAEPHLKRALEVRERVLGHEHPDTLASVNNLALLYHSQGRYEEAEPLVERIVKARMRIKDSKTTVTLRYDAARHHGEAEPHVSEIRKLLGDLRRSTLSLKLLAAPFQQDEAPSYGEAEPLLKRALDARERVLGNEHPATLASLSNLALLYHAQGRHEEAEPRLKQALEARERVLGQEHPDTLASLNDLALLLRVQGRYAEAKPLVERALDARERMLGHEHPDTLASLSNLALLYHAQGRYGEAERLLKRALEARERVLGEEHPDALASLNDLAILYYAQGDWTHAAQFWHRSTAAIAKRSQPRARDIHLAVTGKKKSEADRLSWQFWGLVKAGHRLPSEGREKDGAKFREMFQIAQWALSSDAAMSMAQMAARGAKGDPALAVLVRERQDKFDDWQKLDTWRNTALGQDTTKRDAKAEAEILTQLRASDKRIAEIDERLKAEFPDYFALASTEPLSVEYVQAQLRMDEALVLFLDTPERAPTPEETFIWVVTKKDTRLARSDLGKAALTREVQALRCGLDRAAWRGQSRCPELTGQNYTQAELDVGKPLPFDHPRAHRLYKALFGQVEDLIKGKHLLLVLSGALTQLPFAVLVTAPPANGAHKAVAWLARDHAITVLPAVSALKALRATGHPSAATKPMIGFGNPLLDSYDSQSPGAKLAREKQSCPKTAWQRVAALFGLRDGVAPIETRGGLANVSLIRQQAPLHETADELCSVARDIGADVGEMRLGARATEREVKAMSESGKLAQYRVVHFATHGAMAGELDQSSEPGFILTPPDTASEEDDGYLAAAEIAALKLDADWVILSACNTAAGNAANAQALSGLARAFIYAQARALLVSHWAVDSNATVKLITSAMREIARDRSVGRAEALRRSMLAMIDTGDPHEAHPSYWAPFIVVGEGAR